MRLGPHGLSFVIDPPMIEPDSLRHVVAYWQEKRGARAMAARADIDPLDLKAVLRQLFLIEVLPGASDFRFRLLGTAITERYGRDSTRKTVREVYATTEPAIADWYIATLTAVVTSKRPVLSSGPLQAVQKEHLVFRAIHLPLSDDGETVNVILGATHFAAASPRR